MIKKHPLTHISVPTTFFRAIGLGLLLTATMVQPAFSDSISTDRPDFTEGTHTVSPRTLQCENGLTFSSDLSNSYGELLLRWGLLEGIELRLGLPDLLTEENEPGAFSDTGLGLKFHLFTPEAPGWVPESSLIIETPLPTGTTRFRLSDTQQQAKLCLNWDSGSTWEVGANLMYGQVGIDENRFGQFSSSAVFGVGLSDIWGIFLETYGFFPGDLSGKPAINFDAGLTALVSDDIQLDIRIGKEVDGASFFGLGTAFRLKL